MKFCPFCGELLPIPTAKFCPECGEHLTATGHHSRPEPHEKAPLEFSAEILREEPPNEPEVPDTAAEFSHVTVAVEEDFSISPPSVTDYEDDSPSFNDAAFEETAYSETAYDNTPRPKISSKKAAANAKPIRAKRVSSGKGKIFLVILGALLLLFCAAGYLVLSMNAAKAPAQAAKAFVDAVSNEDVKYVRENIETSGSGLSSPEDVKRLVASMRENLDMSALRDHLTAPDGDIAAGSDENYSCFALKQTKDSLFKQEFVIKITPLQVSVKTTVEDMTLYVDGKKTEATKSESGLMLKLAPGTHSIRAVYETYGPEYELGTSELTGFSSKTPLEVTVTKNLATAEIELAGTETGVQVLIDNEKTDIVPEGGFVELSPAFVGMVVTVKCEEYTEEFTISTGGENSFVVDYIKQLEQENPNGTTVSADMPNRQLISSAAPVFYSFYQSYLEAINRWDKKLIQNVSPDYLADLVKNMEAYNKDLLFEFHGMTFDRRSVSRSIKNDELYVSFRVKVDFNYAYKNDSNKWLAGGNYQEVTMHYVPASKTWQVYSSSVKDSMTISSDVFAIKP